MISVLDKAALPCARRSCDEVWCLGANLKSPSFPAGQRSVGTLKEPKVGIDACAQRFCAEALGGGPNRRPDCSGRSPTDLVQSLRDPVSDLPVGPQAVETCSQERIFVHLHGFALPQSMQSFPCWLHIFLLQALMTSACVWQGQPETSILVNRNWRRLGQVHFNTTVGNRCALRPLRALRR